MYLVPNKFHFVFGLKPQTEPFHLVYYLSLMSCLQVNEPEMIMFHYKYLPYGEWWKKIRPYLILVKVEADQYISAYNYRDKVIERYRYAHLSDITRLEVLLEYGGIYADIDTIFVNKIPSSFFDKPCILGKEHTDPTDPVFITTGGSLCNAWIASEKNSFFIQQWLSKVYSSFDGSWNAHSTYLPYQLSQRFPSDVYIEEERSFYHFNWTKDGIAQLLSGNENNFDGIYSVHLWSHLWWSPHRNDFSTFNNLMINREYVLHEDTTFANLTRRFLR